MKKLVHYLAIMLMIVSPVVLQSCDDDDGYPVDNFVIRMATVRVEGGNTYYLEIDNGQKLWVAATQIPWYRPVNGQRVVADYTLLSDEYAGYDHAVRVNFLRNVLTKQVEELTAANEAEYGNDPVNIYDMWIGGKYFNVQFRFRLPAQNAHRVSLVRNTTVQYPDDGYIYLEYRYNDYDDVVGYTRWGMASFDLGEFAPNVATNYHGIKVKINSAVNGEKTYTFEFPERDSASNQRSVDYADELVEEGTK